MILRRLLRIAAATSLFRAWTQKSPKWTSIALGLVLFRFIDGRSARAKRKATAASRA